LLAGVSTAKANSIVLTSNPYTFKNGGEFTAVTTPAGIFNGNYASVALYNGGFETFCVQTTVYFDLGTSYSYTLANSDSKGNALSLGAAYLYYEFGHGLLPGADYNYSSTAARNTDAGALQAALWYFQGQPIPSGFPSISSDVFVGLAETAAGGTLADALAPNNNTYGVEILQLTDGTYGCVQNQLVLTSVPETTSTLMLLGAALTTLGFAGRKLRSK
jgi:hypothetical protein